MVITASLVILLSAFNGIEDMVKNLYSDFDAPVLVSDKHQKTLFVQASDLQRIQSVNGVKWVSPLIEETIVVRHEDSWSNAQLMGVDSNFLRISKMEEHLLDGFPALTENGEEVGIIGAGLLDKLGGYISPIMGGETVLLYTPKRNLKVSNLSSPFYSNSLRVIARMNFNREVNASYILAPIEQVKSWVDYQDNEYGKIAIGIEDGFDKFQISNTLQDVLGDQFEVKTNDEKNALIYKTSKTERLIVLTILVFIFILASFNLVASLTMLFFEKLRDISVLRSMGLNQKGIFNIFFFEGILVSARGILLGLILGYSICFMQLKWGLLEMPNSFGEPFPIALKLLDLGLIFFMVSLLSLATSFFTVKLLLKRNEGLF